MTEPSTPAVRFGLDEVGRVQLYGESYVLYQDGQPHAYAILASAFDRPTAAEDYSTWCARCVGLVCDRDLLADILATYAATFQGDARCTLRLFDGSGTVSLLAPFRCVSDLYNPHGVEEGYANLEEFRAMCRSVYGEEPILHALRPGEWFDDDGELVLVKED